MKIAVIGVGAMGSVYAGLLADAGNEVWAVDLWREHVDAINANGLRVEGASGDRTVELKATTEVDEVGHADLVVIATKAMHVEAAAKAAGKLLGNDTTVLTIQNGLGSADKVASALGPDRVTLGVAGGFGASLRGPGHVHHNGMELIRLGEVDGPATPRLEAVAEVWREAGFNVRAFDNIHQMVWEKLICNVCFSGSCAITGLTVGEVMADPEAWRVASGCAAEADAVARAKGVALDFDDVTAYVHAFGEKLPNARPSMLLDHLAGRRSEIDAINGAIPPAAEEVGVPAPYNEVVSALVRVKEAGFAV